MLNSIDKLINDAIADSYFPGAVAFVEHQGKTVYHKAFGYASVIPEKHLMDKDMIFDLASLTKIYTSTLLLRLIDEGKLTIESKLHNWFPELYEIGKDITIKHMLTHTSGLPEWYPFYTIKSQGKFISHLLEVVEGQEIFPGNKVEYSDLNFILIGKLIEEIEGMPLNCVISEKLSKPLDMETLQYNPPIHIKPDIVATEWGNQVEKRMVNDRNLQFNHWRENPIWGEVNDGNTYYYLNGISGHAGLFSNVHDVAKLARVYIQSRQLIYGEPFLSAGLVEESYVNHTSEFPEGRGLGWVAGDKDLPGFGHTGFTGTSLWIVPDKDLIMILLTNRLHQQNLININPIRRKFYKEVIEKIK